MVTPTTICLQHVFRVTVKNSLFYRRRYEKKKIFQPKLFVVFISLYARFLDIRLGVLRAFSRRTPLNFFTYCSKIKLPRF